MCNTWWLLKNCNLEYEQRQCNQQQSRWRLKNWRLQTFELSLNINMDRTWNPHDLRETRIKSSELSTAIARLERKEKCNFVWILIAWEVETCSHVVSPSPVSCFSTAGFQWNVKKYRKHRKLFSHKKLSLHTEKKIPPSHACLSHFLACIQLQFETSNYFFSKEETIKKLKWNSEDLKYIQIQGSIIIIIKDKKRSREEKFGRNSSKKPTRTRIRVKWSHTMSRISCYFSFSTTLFILVRFADTSQCSEAAAKRKMK